MLIRLIIAAAMTKCGQEILIAFYRRYISTEMRQNDPYTRSNSRKDYR